jgi:ATP/maltotriose-dependent transcriptional regulator MalT
MPLIRSARARMLMVIGATEEAYGLYEELATEVDSMVVDLRWAPVMFHLAELAVQFDDARTADALAVHLDAWRDLPGAIGTPTAYFAGSALRDLGCLAATTGRLAEAEAMLGGAVQRNLALRARPYVALSRLALAEVLHRSGSLGEASTLARQAADEFRRLEMPGPLLRADQLVAAIAASRDHADPLSTRERQIHDLVVKAMSNREIAAELVLSERTVESHVRSVLAKLGCANRTELIAHHRTARRSDV